MTGADDNGGRKLLVTDSVWCLVSSSTSRLPRNLITCAWNDWTDESSSGIFKTVVQQTINYWNEHVGILAKRRGCAFQCLQLGSISSISCRSWCWRTTFRSSFNMLTVRSLSTALDSCHALLPCQLLLTSFPATAQRSSGALLEQRSYPVIFCLFKRQHPY